MRHIEARIEISTVCNHSCVFCTQNTELFIRKPEIMSNEVFEYIIEEIKDKTNVKILNLCGIGETFMDPDAVYKHRYAINKGFKVNITTNGKMTIEQFNELYKMGVNDFRVSLHSLDEKVYRNITNSDNFKKVIQLIEHIISVDGSRLIISGMPPVNEIDDFRLCYENLVKNLELWVPHNWVDVMNYRNGPSITKSCGRPFNGPLQIQVDQKVIMCNFDYNGINVLGDLKTHSLEEIFESKAYTDLKEAHETGNLDRYICNNCDQRKSKMGTVLYNKLYEEEERVNLTYCYEKIK